MKKDNFDEILTEALRDYIKDTEANAEVVPKVKFSERHEKNMEDIFKAVENGTLGNFEIGENDDFKKNDLIQIKYKKYHFTKLTRIVALILLGLLITLAVTPSMTAWLSEDSEFYGENQDDYAWLLKNDTTKVLESNVEDSGEYLDIFGYLPEGFEIRDVVDLNVGKRIVIKNDMNEEINLKILVNVNRALDMDETKGDVIFINGIKVGYMKSKEKGMFIWNQNNNEYQLYSGIDFEILYKILENIIFFKKSVTF